MLFDLYKRWRHTRGFGIHSPFAYRLVTEAVRPARGYVYHAELLPEMTRLKRIAFRLRTLLISEGYPELIYSFDDWMADPSIPLFLQNPSDAQIDSIMKKLESGGRGLALLSRSFIFAIYRKDMAFVAYKLL